jgi:hypothetical protein
LIALPEWLTDAIRKVACDPVGERLLTDERMKRVWKTLNAEGRRCARDDPDDFEGRLNKLEERYRRETWDTAPPPDTETGFSCLPPLLAAKLAGRMSVDEVNREDARYRRDLRVAYLADSACASFFLAAAIIFTLRNSTVKEYDLEQEAWRWRTGAALCREALSSPHLATVDPALAAALSMSADYFDGHATSIGTGAAASYYVIERNSRLRAPGGGKIQLETKTFEVKFARSRQSPKRFSGTRSVEPSRSLQASLLG